MSEVLLIEQGGNSPIELEFDEEIDDITSFSIGLYSGTDPYVGASTLQKKWDTTSATKTSNTISCPMTQEESKAFLPGPAFLEVKIFKNGETTFFENVKSFIGARKDKDVALS